MLTPLQRAQMRQAKNGTTKTFIAPTAFKAKTNRPARIQIDLAAPTYAPLCITPSNPSMSPDEVLARTKRPGTSSSDVFITGSMNPFMDFIITEDQAFASTIIDPRDLANAYIIIGERILGKVLAPIAAAIDVDEAIEASKLSVGQMKAKIAQKDRQGTERQIVTAFLCQNTDKLRMVIDEIGESTISSRLRASDAIISSGREIQIALALYERRLNVVKCKNISSMLESFALNTLNDGIDPRIKLGQQTKAQIQSSCKKLKERSPCNLMMGTGRPFSLPRAETIEASLAVLVAYEKFFLPDFAPIRNAMAHPDTSLFADYVDFIFNRSATSEIFTMLNKLV